MAESYPNGQKTLWEKEKLLVTGNFSFSRSVFERLVSQGRQKVSLCGNGLKTLCEHEKMLVPIIFSFSHNVFCSNKVNGVKNGLNSSPNDKI